MLSTQQYHKCPAAVLAFGFFPVLSMSIPLGIVWNPRFKQQEPNSLVRIFIFFSVWKPSWDASSSIRHGLNHPRRSRRRFSNSTMGSRVLEQDSEAGSSASCGKSQPRTNSQSLGTSTFRGFIPDVGTNGVTIGLMQIPRRALKSGCQTGAFRQNHHHDLNP